MQRGTRSDEGHTVEMTKEGKANIGHLTAQNHGEMSTTMLKSL